MKSTTTGFVLATAAAALFAMGASATLAHAEEAPMVKCGGINSCKGSSDCKTASSACKGQNACKGQGWNSKASAAECKAAGGTVLK
jgi:hypothetical protein